MLIKVCGMRSPENILELVENQPDYIGFIFYKDSPRNVESEDNIEVIRKLPDSVRKTGVFVNEEISEVFRKAGEYQLDFIQLHGNETPEYCHVLRQLYKVIKVFSVDDAFDFNQCRAYQHHCDYFLFDTKGQYHGGNGVKFNWDKLKEYRFNIPFFLSGGIVPEDAESIAALSHPAFFGIDLNSGFESEKGVKDIQQFKAFKKRII